jgi:hypothetical protein
MAAAMAAACGDAIHQGHGEGLGLLVRLGVIRALGGGAVGKPGGHGLIAGVVVVLAVGEQREDGLLRLTGLDHVGVGHGRAELVEHVGVLAHLLGVAEATAPGRVDHQHRGGRHFHRVACHRDQRGAGHGHAVDGHRLGRLVALERVVDRQPVRDAAAVAVDPHVDGVDGLVEGVELLGHRLRGDRLAPPAVTDVAVDQQLVGVLRTRDRLQPHERLDVWAVALVPGSRLGRHGGQAREDRGGE